MIMGIILLVPAGRIGVPGGVKTKERLFLHQAYTFYWLIIYQYFLPHAVDAKRKRSHNSAETPAASTGEGLPEKIFVIFSII
jgi:hypothetical protein